MAKLFLFAIGGTGARVVKALVMLLASGVRMENIDSIVPIIIDPDSANGDLTRTLEIIKLYNEIRDKAYSPQSDFFNVKITSLDELGEGALVSDNFRFEIDGVKDQRFSEFIGYGDLDRSNQAFISLLFSRANLDANMEVGFKGNPNIGSVVLNKFKDTEIFEKFAASFEEDDRVFIISSIFGGTGAAGFPLILKNIRNAAPPLPHHNFLQNAKIGAVTVLPYFNVQRADNSSIDSNTFISKTKAALSYYARNVSGNGSVNALYYIGDKVTNDQPGADGAQEQKNKAHFVELAAALSITDFMSLQDSELTVRDGKAISPKFYEFGLRRETSSINFQDLAAETYRLIAKPLTQYTLFKNFIEHEYDALHEMTGEAWANHGSNKLNRSALDKRLMSAIQMLNRHFGEWLAEMAASNVAFSVLDHSLRGKNMYNLVNGAQQNKGLLQRWLHGSGISHYRGVLSKLEPSFDNLNSEQKLLALFSAATVDIVKKELKL